MLNYLSPDKLVFPAGRLYYEGNSTLGFACGFEALSLIKSFQMGKNLLLNGNAFNQPANYNYKTSSKWLG